MAFGLGVGLAFGVGVAGAAHCPKWRVKTILPRVPAMGRQLGLATALAGGEVQFSTAGVGQGRLGFFQLIPLGAESGSRLTETVEDCGDGGGADAGGILRACPGASNRPRFRVPPLLGEVLNGAGRWRLRGCWRTGSRRVAARWPSSDSPRRRVPRPRFGSPCDQPEGLGRVQSRSSIQETFLAGKENSGGRREAEASGEKGTGVFLRSTWKAVPGKDSCPLFLRLGCDEGDGREELVVGQVGSEDDDELVDLHLAAEVEPPRKAVLLVRSPRTGGARSRGPWAGPGRRWRCGPRRPARRGRRCSPTRGGTRRACRARHRG